MGLAASFALAMGLALWQQEPEYGTLYSGLDGENVSSVIRALRQNGIPLRVDADGAVRVPVQRLPEARFLMADAGGFDGEAAPGAPVQTRGRGTTSPPEVNIRTLEADYAARIERLLTPLVGPGRVRADVLAQVGPGQGNSTWEHSTGAGTPQRRSSGQGGGDIPHIQRLSVSVVVGDKRVERDGRIAREPLAPDDLARMSALVKGVIGYRETRGDAINIVEAPFASGTAGATGAVQGTDSWWLLAGKFVLPFGIGLAALLLGAGLLRGFWRSAGTQPPSAVDTGPALADAPMQSELAASQGTSPTGGVSDEHVDRLRRLAEQDPKRVAQVVKRWLSGQEQG